MKFCDKVKDFLSVWEGGTYGTYRAALKQFRRYYSDASNGGSICDFLREYSDDQGRPPLEREKVGRKRLRGFVDYLKGRGYAPKTVRSYIAAVQSLVKSCSAPRCPPHSSRTSPRQSPRAGSTRGRARPRSPTS